MPNPTTSPYRPMTATINDETQPLHTDQTIHDGQLHAAGYVPSLPHDNQPITPDNSAVLKHTVLPTTNDGLPSSHQEEPPQEGHPNDVVDTVGASHGPRESVAPTYETQPHHLPDFQHTEEPVQPAPTHHTDNHTARHADVAPSTTNEVHHQTTQDTPQHRHPNMPSTNHMHGSPQAHGHAAHHVSPLNQELDSASLREETSTQHLHTSSTATHAQAPNTPTGNAHNNGDSWKEDGDPNNPRNDITPQDTIENEGEILVHGAGLSQGYAALERAVTRHPKMSVMGHKGHRMDVGNYGEKGTIKGDMSQFTQDEKALEKECDDHNYAAMTGTDGTMQHMQNDMNKVDQDQNNLCFTTGTLITTLKGEKAVEDLQVGDSVRTASHNYKTIAWIAHQDVIFGANDEKPVTIKAHALADGVPYADLTVSAAHGLAFRATVNNLFGRTTKDVLVRASALVNGQTIVQSSAPKATYWHVELQDGHDIVLANGTATESFVDHGERHYFSNATAFKATARHKDCLPRKRRGKYVKAVRNRLNERAQRLMTSATQSKSSAVL